MKHNLAGIGMTSQRTRQRLVNRLRDQGIRSRDVLNVIGDTPRHIFLDEALSHRAYEDVALPIGYNQTISQPYIVAKMTEAILPIGADYRDEESSQDEELREAPKDRDGYVEGLGKVLEVGTGCGYQTAVLARLAREVWSVERIKPLLEKARQNTRLLKLYNVNFRYDDGSLGWRDKGPFDAIIAAAAPRQVPQELMAQLADGGRLVIPVGEDVQELRLIQRRGSRFDTRVIATVRFVPMHIGQTRDR